MTHRQLFRCGYCTKVTALRTLIGYRELEPINFCCPECQQPISAELHLDQEQGRILGYENVRGGSLVFDVPFDHIVNNSPDYAQRKGTANQEHVFSFIEAFQRGGDPYAFIDRVNRQQAFLEIASKQSGTIRRIIRNFQSGRFEYFDKAVRDYVPPGWNPEHPLARYQALALAMEHYVGPIFGTETHFDTNIKIVKWVTEIAQKLPVPYSSFLAEIVSDGSLQRAQRDGLDLYLRFFGIAQDVRPVLPEWDAALADSVDIPKIAVAGEIRFDLVKSLYVDAYEFLSRIASFITGLQNLERSGSHNDYPPHPRLKNYKPRSMAHFATLSNAPKRELLESFWGRKVAAALEPRLRNGLGHFTAAIDADAGVIQYPLSIGASANEVLDYGSFLMRILRVMLRVQEANHLIKTLYASAFAAGIIQS